MGALTGEPAAKAEAYVMECLNCGYCSETPTTRFAAQAEALEHSRLYPICYGYTAVSNPAPAPPAGGGFR